MKFKDLNHRHPDYDAERIRRYDLLYEGGERIIENAHLFIHREPHETDVAYKNRLKWASYKNYMAQIVDSYVADLFSKQLMVTAGEEGNDNALPPFYDDFLKDSDLRANCLDQVMRELTSECMIHGEAYLGVDFPKPEKLPETLKDEEQSGADRAYVFYVENESVIDWELDDRDEYRWMVIRTESAPKGSPFVARDKKLYTFKVWLRQEDRVSFQVWQLEKKIDQEPADTDELTLVDSGEVSFKRIPVLRIRLDEELHLGRLLSSQCVDLFKRGSALLHAQNRSLFAILVYKQGPELPADGSLSEASMDPGRGRNAVDQARSRGGITIGAEDEVSFVEPTGVAFETAHQGIMDDVDELHRVTHTMAMSVKAQSTALGRSGTSKQQDNRAKEIVLSAYAEVVKDFVKKVMSTISDGRNETIEWHVGGMDRYRIVDRELLITEAKDLAEIEIPSKTFVQHRLLRLASDLEDDLSPESLLVIKDEIEAAVSGGWTPVVLQQKAQEGSEGNVGPKSKAPAAQTKKKVRK